MLLTLDEQVELMEILEEQAFYKLGRQFYDYFPDRVGYAKHIKFLSDGATFRQRAFLAGNRVGKSQTGAYEVVCHATGIYPEWWTGKRFDHPTSGWVVGKTSGTVRDTIQIALMGPPGGWGTGMIPRDLLLTETPEASSPRCDIVQVQHISGGISTIGFKTNDSGRQAFEGTSKDYIWLDEETDEGVWFECLTRTMTTDGIVFTTFTPLRGLTPMIISLLKDGNLDTPMEGVSVTTCTWDDAPHLSAETKKEMMLKLPPHQRLARSAGVPMLGAGVIYPEDPATYTITPFEIPKHFLRLGALDVGWKITAALWCAIDPTDGTVYIYSEHYRGEGEPTVHAEAIKARNKEGVIPLEIDSAAHGRSQLDGRNLYTMYEDLGLKLCNANKAVESGLYEVWTLLSARRLKIFANCTNLLSEMKTYRRSEKGQVVKERDHACDCLRYLIMGRDHAISLKPKVIDKSHYTSVSPQYQRTF